MAVELIQPSFTFTAPDAAAAQEAAASVDHFIRLFNQNHPSAAAEYESATDVAVTKFRRFISILDGTPRTGHARFRRGPVRSFTEPEPSPAQPQSDKKPLVQRQQLPPLPSRKEGSNLFGLAQSADDVHVASTANSFQPSISSSSGFQITNYSSGKPPLSSFKRKNCGSADVRATTSSHCHCPKRRKSRLKRVVKVAATSSSMNNNTADIPPDAYSWKKYGQKAIKGSPHPRGYYRCSSAKACPARKHVERSSDEPNVLIVTYEGEHFHAVSNKGKPTPPPLVRESS